MSDVKLLNLDELAAVERAVVIGGKEYPVVEQSVGQMLARLSLSKEQNLKDPEVFLKNMQQTAQDILPSAPKKVIGSLSIKQITRLVEFLNDRELDQAAEQMQKAGEKAEQGDDQGEPEKKS